jgi:hypothetical protein
VGHDVALLVGIIVLFAALSFLAALAIAVWGRRRVFAGAARDAWEQARRDLSRGDEFQVRRATIRRRPVDHAALAPAQLAYSRYVQYTAERSPLLRWPLRTAMVVIYGGNSVLQIVMAVTETRSRALHVVLGVAFAVLTVMYGPLMSRSLSRQPARMRQLRAQVAERYPAD